MKILFLTLASITDIGNRGIYTDLMRKFAEKGHEIFIVCPGSGEQAKQIKCSNSDNLHIYNINAGGVEKNRNLIKKGIDTLTIENKYYQAIKHNLKNIKFDLVLYSTPPITLFKPIKYIKERDNAITYLLLKDIFPQNAVDLKMISTASPIYYMFRRKEKRLYNISDLIGCMSAANRDYLLEHNTYIASEKVHISPNTEEPVQPLKLNDDEKTKIRRKYGVPTDKTVFIYGGNLGKPQGIEFVLECINQNEDNSDSFILIVGSGTEKVKIEEFIRKNNVQNTKLLSSLPRAEYDKLVNSSDVGLIFLDYRFTIPNFPSRLLTYMQCGLPVLAAVDRSTDIGEIIKENNFGEYCNSRDPSEFIKKMSCFSDKDVREAMGENGRRFFSGNYITDNSYDIIMNEINAFKEKKGVS